MRLTCILFLSVAVLFVSKVDAQQNNQPAQEPTIFTSNTQLVVETVTVKDKSGKAIEGLTAKDFTVTEDGAPQTIKFFEFQKLDEVPEPLPPFDGDAPRPAAFSFDQNQSRDARKHQIPGPSSARHVLRHDRAAPVGSASSP